MPERTREQLAARFGWTRRASLTFRILAVNIFALALMAGSLFYLDSYRNQLLAERFKLATSEAEIIADALALARPDRHREIIGRIGAEQDLRLRLFSTDGRLVADSFALTGPSFALVDPATEPWLQDAARAIDRGMDFLLGAEPIPRYREPAAAGAGGWPELAEARGSGRTVVRQRLAPDRTPMISAAIPVGTGGAMLLSLRNAPDITQSVRDARQTLWILVGIAMIVSIQLSLFLARTIVQPLRALVRAAVRVRLGRERAVVVPRLPERGDEIGLLARAISDMTAALRQRIDAVETFAADVAHEIKNPLASLRSALELLEKVDDPALRRQLTGIAAHDVRRIDRLVTEIADASRIDAELSRTTFEDVDIDRLARSLVGARAERGVDAGRKVTIAQTGRGPWRVAGDPARLERVIDNLIDNAVSFSPADGTIALSLARRDGTVELAVSDEGPGIPPEHRERVFERFHSLRPDGEDFGRHSGLGLAIARTIAEAHDGSLVATERGDGRAGARLVLALPALGDWGMTPHQATCVAVRGRGLLIEGPPGSGKSSLALALIDRGAVLVGDDLLLLEVRDGHLLAHPHPRTEGLLEVRNVGLLPFPACAEAPVALVVRLDEDAPRYVEAADRWEQLGCALPLLRLWPHTAVLALRAEQALARYGK